MKKFTEMELNEMKIGELKETIVALGEKVGTQRTKPQLIARILKAQEVLADEKPEEISEEVSNNCTEETTEVEPTEETTDTEVAESIEATEDLTDNTEKVVLDSNEELVKPEETTEEEVIPEEKPEEVKSEEEVENEPTCQYGTKQDLKDLLHDMPNEDLIDFAKGEEVTWKENSNVSINRMFCCMAIVNKYFPNATKSKKKGSSKKSPWSKIGTEKLTEVCKRFGLKVNVNPNEPIRRMWLIYELKKANIDIAEASK